MTTSEQIKDIAAALSKAQGAMAPAIKDSTNPHFRSKYADLAANVEAARGPLAANGLAVVQEATTVDGAIAVATRILHSSGQWIQCDPLMVPLSKGDAHGVGSATTYARRYALGAVLGLVAEDDDGNAAVQGHGRAVESQPAAPPKGYAAWVDDMRAVADEGTAALTAAWKASKPEFRSHMLQKERDTLKARAAAVKEPEAVGA